MFTGTHRSYPVCDLAPRAGLALGLPIVAYAHIYGSFLDVCFAFMLSVALCVCLSGLKPDDRCPAGRESRIIPMGNGLTHSIAEWMCRRTHDIYGRITSMTPAAEEHGAERRFTIRRVVSTDRGTESQCQRAAQAIFNKLSSASYGTSLTQLRCVATSVHDRQNLLSLLFESVSRQKSSSLIRHFAKLYCELIQSSEHSHSGIVLIERFMRQSCVSYEGINVDPCPLSQTPLEILRAILVVACKAKGTDNCHKSLSENATPGSNDALISKANGKIEPNESRFRLRAVSFAAFAGACLSYISDQVDDIVSSLDTQIEEIRDTSCELGADILCAFTKHAPITRGTLAVYRKAFDVVFGLRGRGKMTSIVGESLRSFDRTTRRKEVGRASTEASVPRPPESAPLLSVRSGFSSRIKCVIQLAAPGQTYPDI